jgi:hypothetical protein
LENRTVVIKAYSPETEATPAIANPAILEEVGA